MAKQSFLILLHLILGQIFTKQIGDLLLHFHIFIEKIPFLHLGI